MHATPGPDHPAPQRSIALTNRRTFVAFGSLGAASLYGLWAALGAAPLRFWEAPADADAEAGHGGHDGHGDATGPSPDDFRAQVDAFVTAHRQADGSVLVEPSAADTAMPDMPGMDMSHAGHDMSGMDHSAQAMDHSAEATDNTGHGAGPAAPAVYLLAEKWAFEPSWIRLRAGTAYKLKMMAIDAAHGASLQLGPASQIMRLPRGMLVERDITFTRPGTYLLYCTMYCGEGHHLMSGKIEVL